MGKRTAEWMRKAAEEMGLRPGRKVKAIEIALGGGENHKSNYYRNGTVLQLFAHVFLCDMGGYKECFRYNELLGDEAGKKVRLRGV